MDGRPAPESALASPYRGNPLLSWTVVGRFQVIFWVWRIATFDVADATFDVASSGSGDHLLALSPVGQG